MQVADKKVVSMQYKLTNDSGEVLDQSQPDSPLIYLHGSGNIIPGLEKGLDGKAAGDVVNVRVSAEEAYGVRDESMVQVLPRSAFQGVDNIETGMQFQAESPNGAVMITVTKINNDEITVDGNHPLAGEALTFDVEITDIRDATAEELDHGHVHGPGGHH
ncbi:MAG: peptidylprolyl isomerase [Gammaproteobacteria bacterium]|nr:peptidylprolyl isomerase [Gammaproteobacteria bacterium]